MAGNKKIKEALSLLKTNDDKTSFEQIIDAYETLSDADINAEDYSYFLKVKNAVDTYDKNQGIDNLSFKDGISISKNYVELEHITKDYNPFAKDQAGKYVYPENEVYEKFIDNIEYKP